MTDVVCGTGCAFFGTPAKTDCGNTTSAPTGHLLLKEKALGSDFFLSESTSKKSISKVKRYYSIMASFVYNKGNRKERDKYDHEK